MNLRAHLLVSTAAACALAGLYLSVPASPRGNATAALLDPGQMTLVVTPLVGFDHRGHRLGMGGGWYDRSFAFRRDRAAPPWLVGAAFDTQRVDALDRADWDIPLDAVCTQSITLDCTQAPA